MRACLSDRFQYILFYIFKDLWGNTLNNSCEARCPDKFYKKSPY